MLITLGGCFWVDDTFRLSEHEEHHCNECGPGPSGGGCLDWILPNVTLSFAEAPRGAVFSGG